jgi:hypothetical protein
MFSSIGTLHYDPKRQEGGFYKLTAAIDPEITRYYRALVPRSVRLNPQLYAPHISVVRREVPPKMENWKKHEGEEIEFFYDGYIHNDETYFWLNIFCVSLEEIRTELGLPVSSPYTLPPDGFNKCFHSTIGNTKRL